jgi:sugar lactone lactonase YvrE
MWHLAMLLAATLLADLSPGAQETPRTAGIPGVVAPETTLELVQEGFAFAEGVVGTPDGGGYFSDILWKPTRIYRITPGGEVIVFRENTGAANGLALDRAGNLVTVERDGKRVVRMDTDGKVTVIVTGPGGGREFLAPNDLIVDERGGIYLSDPWPHSSLAGARRNRAPEWLDADRGWPRAAGGRHARHADLRVRCAARRTSQ